MRDNTPLWRLSPPTVSIVVPFYNVEDYLGECLDSIADQTFGHFEVLLVDDGSPDGSRAIADRHAKADPRLRVITRENGGLGAARNTGVRRARGRFLTFVDSDDLLPAKALEVMVGSARRTGADIVTGGVRRFDPHRAWRPAWVREVHLIAREGVTIEEFPALLRNLYTWNKLFRRDFWDKQQLWFREGVAYEDQPIITQLFARARSIDVLSEVVYAYRMRDDSSSISQQTASLKDLRDRVSAWQATRAALRTEDSPNLYRAWLQTLFSAHFHWYLNSGGTSDDTYWHELQEAVRELTEDVPQEMWDNSAPADRVMLQLARLDRRHDAQEFVRRGGRNKGFWPSRVTPEGVQLELPLFDDPTLADDLFLLRPEQLTLGHAVESFRWLGDHEHGVAEISGWAYLTKVDLTDRDSTATLLLRNQRTGAEVEVPTTKAERAQFSPPVDDDWCDYDAGTFVARVDIGEITARGEFADLWTMLLRVESAGFTVTEPVTQLVRSGSAGVISARTMPDDSVLATRWRVNEPLGVMRTATPLIAREARLEGRRLTGVLSGELTREVKQVRVFGGARRAGARVAPGPQGATFRITLPQLPDLTVADGTRWRLQAVTNDGETHDLAVATEPDDSSVTGGRVLALQRTLRGHLVVDESLLRATAEAVEVTEADAVEVSGTLLSSNAAAVSLVARSRKSVAEGEPVALVGDRFTARLPLVHDGLRFGLLPLPHGEHELSVRVRSKDGSTVEVPLLMTADLGERLPVRVQNDVHEGLLLRGRGGCVRVSLARPTGEDKSRYRRHQLRASISTPDKLTRGVLFRSYFGEGATDNGLSIQRELRRRGSDLPVYWAVHDHSVPVPEGGIPVVVNSREWYELLFSVAYYVDNMYQPEYHRKPAGQVIVQTFHGYPFKTMGHPHWRVVPFSQDRIDSYDARAREWDYLVSPARYATPLLTRDFAYDGEVLEIGYPRNDVLQSTDAEQLRVTVRRSLGIRENQTAVLYAPTFRDYLAKRDNVARMPDFFDFKAATRALGDNYVFLVRGHAFNARTSQRVAAGSGRVVDVTDYPEVSDLYLAADAAVVDYSSLRFDFAITGKPMIFHVPDLQRFKETRGWLMDFEPTAPGPLVDTTTQVVRALKSLDHVQATYADAYATFRGDYLDLEDGRAGERFVDAVFAPRGDA